jgi:hypothetical protein
LKHIIQHCPKKKAKLFVNVNVVHFILYVFILMLMKINNNIHTITKSQVNVSNTEYSYNICRSQHKKVEGKRKNMWKLWKKELNHFHRKIMI